MKKIFFLALIATSFHAIAADISFNQSKAIDNDYGIMVPDIKNDFYLKWGVNRTFANKFTASSLQNNPISSQTQSLNLNWNSNIDLGWQFSRFIGIEGGVHSLGNYSYQYADTNNNLLSDNIQGQTIDVSLVGRYEVLANFPDLTMTAKAGLAHSVFNYNTVNGVRIDATRITPVIGAGLHYKVSNQYGVFLDWNNYLLNPVISGSVSEVSAGVKINFNK